MGTTVEVDPNGDLLLQFFENKPNNDLDTRESPSPRPIKRARWDNDNETDSLRDSLRDRLATAGESCATQPSMNLRVSSSILSLVSPVFKSMLTGPLAEGVAFRAANSPRPFPLSLPDDDCTAFTVLVNIAHHKAELVSINPASSLLLELALLADKYDCAHLFSPYGILWLQRGLNKAKIDMRDDCINNRDEMQHLCDMLLFAYTIDLPAQFAECSWYILLRHRQSVKDELDEGFDLPVGPEHELLRHDIHSELQRRKACLRRDIHKTLMEPVAVTMSQLTYSATQKCPRATSAIGNYMQVLNAHALCPWNAQFETDSFSAIIERAALAAESEASNDLLFFEPCTRKNPCICANMKYANSIHLAKRLDEAIQRARRWNLWLCLDCLKTGGSSADKKTCRVSHWDDPTWSGRKRQ